jgi:D-glycero-D-manno-heptose 1,7-bisphosphate phosphatase
MMNRAIFLDRDGTLNLSYLKDLKTTPPKSSDEIIILDGVTEGLDILKKLKFKLIVITNQPDYIRGSTSLKTLIEINSRICSMLDIDFAYMCLHDDGNKCPCRKPGNGFFLQASKDLEINLAESYLIGDRLSDVQAGIASGCISFLIENNANTVANSYIGVSSLLEAVKLISEREPSNG